MRNKHQRDNLAITCALTCFNMYFDPAFKESKLKKENMPDMISTNIRLQACLYSIPENQQEQMILEGLNFYKKQLEALLPG